MALTKDKKHDIVNEVTELLVKSKLTVVTKYEGTPVKAMQELRHNGEQSGTTLKVVKNRLVIKALQANDSTKDIAIDTLNGMLLYAFNDTDEVAPAKTIAEFAKKQPTLEFVAGISEEGKLLSADEVKALATLPSKDELIAQVVATLQSPTNDVLNGLGGGLSGILSGLEANAKA